ncbi:UvrD-helicase domain-containing protein [Legionella brunensis]|uniref:DNA 3'-5' helicase II n=1 Tax=Legionella brunensis TaxID=29422 RepID=A0A0W0S4D6_9GAMM|nr:UvrD-helicase domain-containing protein [Legionella brunensis]KTC78391.1 UvrD/REP helicase [Legionella brunensis]
MTIYYWEKLIGDPVQLASYQETINKLVRGDYNAADLEQLKGHRVYSVRINQSDRLLFTTIHIQGKPCLLLLEVVLNHKYHRSRFLNPTVLKNHINANIDGLTENVISEKSFVSCSKDELVIEKDLSEKVQYSRVEFYNKTFVEFNNQQQQAQHASLPMLVSGPPGSGKSCVAFSLLAQAVTQLSETDESILYITESKKLVDELEKMWGESAISQGLSEDRVQFKTYAQLLAEVAPETKDKIIVGELHFREWLVKYLNKQKQILKAAKKETGLLDIFATKVNEVYQELRILGAYTPKEYMELGKKQSLFKESSQKQWLVEVYQAYAKELTLSNCLNPTFYSFESNVRYSRIMVDEAQDFSHFQLQKLAELAISENICFFMDSHQSLNDKLSKRPFLLDLFKNHESFKQQQRRMTHIELPATYRCPPNIINLSNGIIAIKNSLTGGIADKKEFIEIASYKEAKIAGNVQWRDGFTSDDLAQLIQVAQTPSLAVVTHKEYKKEAADKFKTVLVFSTDEIKGLEYPIVVGWRLLDDELFIEANDILTHQDSDTLGKATFRAKDGVGDDKFGPLFNKLFVAVTRCQSDFVFYQPKNRKLATLTRLLQNEIAQTNSQKRLSYKETPSSSNWYEEAKRQYENGNIELARQIFYKLGLQEADFINYFKPKEQESSAVLVEAPVANNTQEVVRAKNKKGVASKKVANARAPKQNVSALDDKQLYVQGLLKNCTENNLISLFKSNRTSKYLFEVIVPGKDCLFVELIRSEATCKLLTKVLRANPRFAEKITAAHLESSQRGTEKNALLFTLMQRVDGQLLFDALVEVNRELIEKLSSNIFFQTEGTPNGISIFSAMILGQVSQATLLKFVKHWRSPLTNISFDILSSPFSPNDKVWRNVSPLHGFASTESGKELILNLLEQNPEFSSLFTTEFLCSSVSRIEKGDSLLALLAVPSRIGQEIIKLLLHKNPKLTIPAEKLFKLYSTKLVKDGSLIFWLAQFPTGIEILHLLVEREPSFIEKISATILLHETITNGSSSPLFWLVTEDLGHHLVIELINSKPSLLDELARGVYQFLVKNKEKKVLLGGKSIETGKSIQAEFLYALFANDNEGELFKLLTQKEPAIFKAITSSMLCQVEEGIDSSILYLLARDEDGQKTLLQMVQQNPRIADRLLVKTLTQDLTPYPSAIGYLTETARGFELLAEIFKNVELIGYLPATILNEMHSAKDKSRRRFILEYLTSSVAGLKFLSHLIKHSDILRKNIEIEILTASVQHAVNTTIVNSNSAILDEEIMSLFWLLLKDRRDLGHTSFLKAFFFPLEASIFYQLAKSTNGPGLLLHILQQNPKLVGIFLIDAARHCIDDLIVAPEGEEIVKLLVKTSLDSGVDPESLIRNDSNMPPKSDNSSSSAENEDLNEQKGSNSNHFQFFPAQVSLSPKKPAASGTSLTLG